LLWRIALQRQWPASGSMRLPRAKPPRLAPLPGLLLVTKPLIGGFSVLGSPHNG